MHRASAAAILTWGELGAEAADCDLRDTPAVDDSRTGTSGVPGAAGTREGSKREIPDARGGGYSTSSNTRVVLSWTAWDRNDEK